MSFHYKGALGGISYFCASVALSFLILGNTTICNQVSKELHLIWLNLKVWHIVNIFDFKKQSLLQLFGNTTDGNGNL